MTDTRISHVGLEALTQSTPDVRASHVGLEVLAPLVSLPDRPWIVQVDWPNRTAAGRFPWTESVNPYLNFLTESATTCLHKLQWDRRAAHQMNPQLRTDFYVVEYYDQNGDVIPGKSASVLSPNVVFGRAARVLAVRNGVVYPRFYGTITGIEPTDEDRRYGRLRIESPLRVLGPLPVTLDSYTDGAVATILTALFDAANIPAANRSIDAVSATVPGTWGGEMTFAAALRDLVVHGDLIVRCEPRYRVAAGEVDYVIRVKAAGTYAPASSPAAATWSAAAGDLNGPQDAVWLGEGAA